LRNKKNGVRIFWFFLFLAFWAAVIFFYTAPEEEVGVIKSEGRVEDMEAKVVGEKDIQIVDKTSGEYLEKFTIGWSKNFFRKVRGVEKEGRIVIMETGPFWVLIGGFSCFWLLVFWGVAVLLAEVRKYN